jgi:hypothetical protein
LAIGSSEAGNGTVAWLGRVVAAGAADAAAARYGATAAEPIAVAGGADGAAAFAAIAASMNADGVCSSAPQRLGTTRPSGPAARRTGIICSNKRRSTDQLDCIEHELTGHLAMLQEYCQLMLELLALHKQINDRIRYGRRQLT